jgi:hypothetical protein
MSTAWRSIGNGKSGNNNMIPPAAPWHTGRTLPSDVPGLSDHARVLAVAHIDDAFAVLYITTSNELRVTLVHRQSLHPNRTASISVDARHADMAWNGKNLLVTWVDGIYQVGYALLTSTLAVVEKAALASPPGSSDPSTCPHWQLCPPATRSALRQRTDEQFMGIPSYQHLGIMQATPKEDPHADGMTT